MCAPQSENYQGYKASLSREDYHMDKRLYSVSPRLSTKDGRHKSTSSSVHVILSKWIMPQDSKVLYMKEFRVREKKLQRRRLAIDYLET